MENISPMQQPYLSPQEQQLLLAALAAQQGDLNGAVSGNQNPQRPAFDQRHSSSGSHPNEDLSGVSPTDSDPLSALYGDGVQPLPDMSFDGSPYGDETFDFDAEGDPSFLDGADVSPQNWSNGQEDPESNGSDLHDKRKSIGGIEEMGNSKRHEGGEEKIPRKPGRKPLTSEPTTKRKAQNRAAQRAFRDRKEKHLKDLETKVVDLEKASDAANHENHALRTQVEKLQGELHTYRKRMSVNAGGVARSSPKEGLRQSPNALNSNNNFQFDFPRFSPEGRAQQSSNSSSSANGNLGSTRRSIIDHQLFDPSDLGNDSNGPLPLNGSEILFPSPKLSFTDGSKGQPRSLFGSNQQSNSPRNDSQSSSEGTSSGTGNTPSSLLDLSHTATATASPSASSVSQQGPTSSCETSPEPSHQSPKQKVDQGLKSSEKKEDCGCDKKQGGAKTPAEHFCKELSKACGDCNDPVPEVLKDANKPSTETSKSTMADVNGIDWMAQQNGGQFDPVLFGDYRESQDLLSQVDLGNFFDDAFPMPDLGSPMDGGEAHTENPPAPPKRDFMQEIDALANGEASSAPAEEVVPGEDKSKMLNCNNIWDKVQSSDSYKSGDIDMDGLCSELRKKARCSETGVVIEKNDFEGIMAMVPPNFDKEKCPLKDLEGKVTIV